MICPSNPNDLTLSPRPVLSFPSQGEHSAIYPSDPPATLWRKRWPPRRIMLWVYTSIAYFVHRAPVIRQRWRHRTFLIIHACTYSAQWKMFCLKTTSTFDVPCALTFVGTPSAASFIYTLGTCGALIAHVQILHDILARRVSANGRETEIFPT